jgi:hypothetical protein
MADASHVSMVPTTDDKIGNGRDAECRRRPRNCTVRHRAYFARNQATCCGGQ